VVATKFGRHVGETQITYDAAMIRAALERSLKALQTTYVDLYQVHWGLPACLPECLEREEEEREWGDWSDWRSMMMMRWIVRTPGSNMKDVQETVDVLEALRTEGKIRYYGVSNFGVKHLAAFLAACLLGDTPRDTPGDTTQMEDLRNLM